MKNNLTDKELIDGCIGNDRYSQELLYRRYFASMMAMCMKYTHDQNKSIEIVNNGFLKVFKKIDTYSFKGSLEGWIRRIVYHSLSDYFREETKYVKLMVFEERDMEVAEKATEQIYLEDILSMVNQLPPATQAVFRLYAIEGYTHLEIAEEMNISVGTSKWHLSNAREKLKAFLYESNKKIG